MKTIEIQRGHGIDRFLKENRERGTVFLLEEGDYWTQGAFGFAEHDLCMLAPDCKLFGQGARKTRIRVTEESIAQHSGKPTHYIEGLTGGARRKLWSDSIQMEGFELKIETPLPVKCLHVWSSNAVIRDIHVNGVFGDRDAEGSEREGFGILVNRAFGRGYETEGGAIVEDCLVTCRDFPKENYSTGIYVGIISRSLAGTIGEMEFLKPSIVQNCTVLAQDAHCAIAFNDRTLVENVDVSGFRRAIFMDTGPVRDSMVRNMNASRVSWAADIRAVSPYDTRNNIFVKHSTFSFRPLGEWSQVVLLEDLSPSKKNFGSVVFKGCDFVSAMQKSNSKGRLNGVTPGSCQFVDCTWNGEWDILTLQNQPMKS